MYQGVCVLLYSVPAGDGHPRTPSEVRPRLVCDTPYNVKVIPISETNAVLSSPAAAVTVRLSVSKIMPPEVLNTTLVLHAPPALLVANHR